MEGNTRRLCTVKISEVLYDSITDLLEAYRARRSVLPFEHGVAHGPAMMKILVLRVQCNALSQQIDQEYS